ncbi:shikimate kinase [Pseudolactococcus yaeyamensis]
MTTFLIGFMGSGKTTIAQLLTEDFIDMDQVIVARIGMPISTFFAEAGEATFREIESEILEILSKTGGIISTGGGVVMSEENRRILRESKSEVIYLKSDFDALYQRITVDSTNIRPLFINNSRAELQAIFESRAPLYESVATRIITVSDKTPEEIIKEIRR